MPASGKSTVGVLVAKGLGFDFVDTDLLLQRQEGLKLHEILARDGVALFLATEARLLSGLSVSQSIVSTGGSAVYHARGMEHLKSLGTVVWLDVPYEEVERRLGDMVTRGVVLKPGQTLRDLFEERRPLYESWADLRFAVGQEPLEVTANRLVALLR
jgi:shikimate kinase